MNPTTTSFTKNQSIFNLLPKAQRIITFGYDLINFWWVFGKPFENWKTMLKQRF
jgi:hypothetical protein